ncbi:uncharacterized protein BJ171DRAFT_612885 [Polychytrium aggregatum]|uniref:uncharacterized protein n=1 Tax=Polychytrium aggregatum TaxID=110093 RepID=UPI0022FE72AC|nr:uncharacterized protein BJ171DRAFT_612885 [Polychytrium aggregatum]KAI9206245.1 hypothetical protein BJ171DRAFT_612885 [Polychytrium aggregatum]
MGEVAIPKPETEDPRPQRRHFINARLRDRQSKMLKEDLRRFSEVSTYQSEYIGDDTKTSYKTKPTVRVIRPKLDPDTVLLNLKRIDQIVVSDHISKNFKALDVKSDIKSCQDEIDKYMHESTYQSSFNDRGIYKALLPKFPIEEKEPKFTLSLYQNSYVHPRYINSRLCSEEISPYGMTKSLYLQPTAGMGVRDLLHTQQASDVTSYKSDFKLCPPIETPEVQVTDEQMRPRAPTTIVRKALKYRRYYQ